MTVHPVTSAAIEVAQQAPPALKEEATREAVALEAAKEAVTTEAEAAVRLIRSSIGVGQMLDVLA